MRNNAPTSAFSGSKLVAIPPQFGVSRFTNCCPSLAVMAQSGRFFDDVKKELECSVCQEQFSELNEPKILKCLHTFCKNCLEAWLRQQREGGLSCPTCRQITDCPNNDISRLPSNLFCKQLVEIVEAYSGQGYHDSPQCGNCDEGKYLKFYCSHCNCFLCEDCARVHKKGKLFKGHHVKEIRNFESSDVQDYARRANFCKKHRDEVRFFCENCQICICRDCAILEHQDHTKISLDQGLESNKSEIETRMRNVQERSSCLKIQKDFLEKRKLKVNKSIEEATSEVKRIAELYILLIRQHEASVTERLAKQKAAFQDSFAAQMTNLDGQLTNIEGTLEFCEEVLFRNNLPEILNVKATIEQRLQELSSPPEFNTRLDYTGVKYVPNDLSFVPGKLVTTNTDLSVAEGKSLTEALVGEDCTFTVITKDSVGQKTYSEIDEISVSITSSSNKQHIETALTNLKDGRYAVSYRPTTPGEFTVAIKVAGTSIMGSPFTLTVQKKPVNSRRRKSRKGITAVSSYATRIEGTEIKTPFIFCWKCCFEITHNYWRRFLRYPE